MGLKRSRDRQRAAGHLRRSFPLAYFLTFTCYGARLHGDDGSVDRYHRHYKSPFLAASRKRKKITQTRMRHSPYTMDVRRRALVLEALKETCRYKGWMLLAAQVRTNHVHVVVEASLRPEKILTALKAYSSRRLNRSGLDHAGVKRWTRHGSTVYLWDSDSVQSAIQYVIGGQGEPMAVFEREVGG